MDEEKSKKYSTAIDQELLQLSAENGQIGYVQFYE